MAPRTILLMRHAEKPDDPTSPYLSDAGRDRAEKLAQYIPATYGKPDFVFAAAEHQKSIRSYLTMKPLCDTIAVPLDSTTPAKDYQALATTLLSDDIYAARLVAVCWPHGELPALCGALGARQGDYPDPWDSSVFDLILQLDYTSNDAPPGVTRVNEPF
ncbi:MAG: histidine phosphatase family protein [Casimicrobiaceae bacterium]